MAKKKINLNSAFLTDDIINNQMIEKAVYQNLERINYKKIAEIHDKLMTMIDAKSNDDCVYFERHQFMELIEHTKKNKAEKIKLKVKVSNNEYRIN